MKRNSNILTNGTFDEHLMKISQFLKDAYKEFEESGFSVDFEKALLVINGIVVYCYYNPDDEKFLNVEMYDFQHREECGGYIIDAQNIWFSHLMTEIQTALVFFYRNYVQECIDKNAPIYLPECEIVRYDRKEKEWYYRLGHTNNREWVYNLDKYFTTRAEVSNAFWF